VRRAGRDRREAASQRDAGQRLANDPLGDERWNAWIELVAAAIAAEAPETDAQAAAERLTALVDGLAARWLAGALELERAHALLEAAIGRELT
jgi:hypothetical protein